MQRLWYPDFLIDEYLPTGRVSPDAWLAPLDKDSDDLDDEGYYIGLHADYMPGSKLGFKWMEHHGLIALTINPDGSLHGTQRCPFTLDLFGHAGIDLPAAERSVANNFYDDESELWADSAEGFARMYAEGFDVFGADDAPVTVEVDASHWSDTQYFIISPDGKSLLPAPSPETPNVHG